VDIVRGAGVEEPSVKETAQTIAATGSVSTFQRDAQKPFQLAGLQVLHGSCFLRPGFRHRARVGQSTDPALVSAPMRITPQPCEKSATELTVANKVLRFRFLQCGLAGVAVDGASEGPGLDGSGGMG
jgi:hypothetical protein